eukprot:446228_1
MPTHTDVETHTEVQSNNNLLQTDHESNHNNTAIKQSNANIIKSLQNRKNKKKQCYKPKFKLEVIDYIIDKGGSYQSVVESPTFVAYNLNKSCVGDWYRNRVKIRKQVEDGLGDKKKVHKGGKVKYKVIEDVLWDEHKRRKALGLDVSRDWAKDRAGELFKEYQATGDVKQKPYKKQWTPHDIAKQDKYERKLQSKIDRALRNGHITLFPASNGWFYGFIGRKDKRMKYSYCTKDMTVDEWICIKFNVFLPTEISFLCSLQNPAIFDEHHRLKRILTWNDDEVPLDFYRRRKQISESDIKKAQMVLVKQIFSTRDITKRFATLLPFINGDAFRTIPFSFAKLGIILPGSISASERRYYEQHCPNLATFSNKRAWMEQQVWDEWSEVKLRVIRRVRRHLKQADTIPHFNYLDMQPNHASQDTIEHINPRLEREFVYVRNYPAKSTLHCQAVDRHFGRCLQTKANKAISNIIKKQHNKLMMGQSIHKITLPEMRKKTCVIMQKVFMETIKEHKHLQLSAFDSSGLNYYPHKVFGGFEQDNIQINAVNVNDTDMQSIDNELNTQIVSNNMNSNSTRESGHKRRASVSGSRKKKK